MKILLLNITVLFSLIISFLMGTVFFSTAIIAQQNNPFVSSDSVSGVVLKTNGNQISLQTENDIQEFNIPNNVKITKNGIQSEINNIKPNDRAVITLDNNGNILSVDSVSGMIFDVGRWFLPLASLLLVALGITFILNSKSQRGHFKTKTITN